MSFILLGILNSQVSGGFAIDSDYDLLESDVLGSAQGSVSFQNLNTAYSSTYQHLQLRFAVRHETDGGGVDFIMRLNNDTGSNYYWRFTRGSGTGSPSAFSLQGTSMFLGQVPRTSEPANGFESGIIDILDPFESSKRRVIRGMGGRALSTAQNFWFHSGIWNNTTEISTITVQGDAGNLGATSRVSLYGLKKAGA